MGGTFSHTRPAFAALQTLFFFFLSFFPPSLFSISTRIMLRWQKPRTQSNIVGYTGSSWQDRLDWKCAKMQKRPDSDTHTRSPLLSLPPARLCLSNLFFIVPRLFGFRRLHFYSLNELSERLRVRLLLPSIISLFFIPFLLSSPSPLPSVLRGHACRGLSVDLYGCPSFACLFLLISLSLSLSPFRLSTLLFVSVPSSKVRLFSVRHLFDIIGSVFVVLAARCAISCGRWSP